MSKLLRLYLSERWPEESKAAWALFGATGALLQEGVSDPAAWPQALEHEAVLTACQCAWLRTSLPRSLPRGEEDRLIANALEDKLVEDPARYHPTLTGRQGTDAAVLVIARDRLRKVTQSLQALGRPLSRACSELQTAPFAPPDWHVCLGSESAVLKRDHDDAVAIDVLDRATPPTLLRSLGEEGAPPGIVLHCAPGSDAPDTRAWQEALGHEVRSGDPYVWHRFGRDAANLLHGELAPTHRDRAWLQRAKPALWLAAAAVLLDVALGSGELAWRHYELRRTESRMVEMFREAFPEIPVIDAAAQARRQLDTQRSAHGLLRADDAMALLAALADALGENGRDAVRELRFDEGGLHVTLSPAAAPRVEPVRGRLAASGLAATQSSAADGVLELTLRNP